jgi:hypothetical protein
MIIIVIIKTFFLTKNNMHPMKYVLIVIIVRVRLPKLIPRRLIIPFDIKFKYFQVRNESQRKKWFFMAILIIFYMNKSPMSIRVG